MTRLIASLLAIGMLAGATPALADCAGHRPTQSTQSAPVVTSDATAAPTTPIPAPATTDATKTGG
ncbi:MAG: hypothetical protein ACREEE_07290 [Dongiaceae bacterium]